LQAIDLAVAAGALTIERGASIGETLLEPLHASCDRDGTGKLMDDLLILVQVSNRDLVRADRDGLAVLVQPVPPEFVTRTPGAVVVEVGLPVHPAVLIQQDPPVSVGYRRPA